MTDTSITYIPSAKQNAFHGANEFETLMIGARGAAKTYAGVMECYMLALEYPGNVGLMVRKQMTNLLTTTLATWKKIIPPNLYTINEQKHIITVFTGKKENSIIHYAGLDDQESIRKYRGMEIGYVLFDQAEECDPADITELIPAIRHRLPNGKSPHYRVMYLANPQQSYILTRFTQHKTDKMKLIQVSVFDNPYREAGYVERLTDNYKFDKKMYDAMVLGSIEIADVPNSIISYSKINEAMKRRTNVAFFDKKVVSVDVAREGDDNTCIIGWQGCKVVNKEVYGKKDLDVTAARAVAMQKKIGANCIIWDADGIGGGLLSHLKGLVEEGTSLMEFHGSGTSSDTRYLNQRACAWFEAAELFNNDIPAFEHDEPILRDQLASLRYEPVLGGKLKVEDKKLLKKRSGKSPDEADAYVYGIYALKRAPSLYSQPVIRKNTMAELIQTIEDEQEDAVLSTKEHIGNHNCDKW